MINLKDLGLFLPRHEDIVDLLKDFLQDLDFKAMKKAQKIGKDVDGTKASVLGSNRVKEGMVEKEIFSKCPLYLEASCVD